MTERLRGLFRTLAVPVPIIVATAIALAVLAGTSPVAAGSALVQGMFGTSYDIGSALNGAAVLALVGGGYLLAARAGLINVGGEGQIAVGGLLAAAVALHPAANLPAAIAVPLVVLTGAVGGAAWAGIAIALRLWRGTNEVLSTLLLNFIGISLVSLAVHANWLLRQPVTSAATLPQSLPLPPPTRLPLLQPDGPATIAAVVAVVVLIFIGWTVRVGWLGLAWRAVASSERAATRMGLRVDALRARAFLSSGALGGIAGAMLVATSPFILQDGFTSGYGFEGLVIGLLAGRSAVGLGIGALAFGLLDSSGLSLQVQAGIPATAVQVLEATVVLAVAGTVLRSRRTAVAS